MYAGLQKKPVWLFMKASFVIVNYNRKDELLLTLSKTMELIRESVSDFEIVVVDNASTDNSAEEVKLKFPEVLLIQNRRLSNKRRSSGLECRF